MTSGDKTTNQDVVPAVAGPGSYVQSVGPNDVLLGRGAPIINNEGNVRFRKVVADRKAQYTASCRHQLKNKIACEVIDEIMKVKNGRFLRKVEDPNELKELGVPADVTAWVVVDDSVVLQKVKQALREHEGRDKHSSSPTNEPATQYNDELVSGALPVNQQSQLMGGTGAGMMHRPDMMTGVDQQMVLQRQQLLQQQQLQAQRLQLLQQQEALLLQNSPQYLQRQMLQMQSPAQSSQVLNMPDMMSLGGFGSSQMRNNMGLVGGGMYPLTGGGLGGGYGMMDNNEDLAMLLRMQEQQQQQMYMNQLQQQQNRFDLMNQNQSNPPMSNQLQRLLLLNSNLKAPDGQQQQLDNNFIANIGSQQDQQPNQRLGEVSTVAYGNATGPSPPSLKEEGNDLEQDGGAANPPAKKGPAKKKASNKPAAAKPAAAKPAAANPAAAKPVTTTTKKTITKAKAAVSPKKAVVASPKKPAASKTKKQQRTR